MHRLPQVSSLQEFLAHRARILLVASVLVLILAGVVTLFVDVVEGGLQPWRVLGRLIEFSVGVALLGLAARDLRRWQDWLVVACTWIAITDGYGNASLLEPAAAVTGSGFLTIALGLFPVSFRRGLPRFGLVAAGALIGLALGGIYDAGLLVVPIISGGLGLLLAHVQYSMVADSWTLRDIAVQASERAEEAARAKARFLGGVSHEMRTPLHGLFGLLDEARRGPLTSPQAEALLQAEHAADQLAMLVEDALALAERGQAELAVLPEPTHVLVAVRSALAAVPRGVDLRVLGLPAGPVDIDPRRVQQVLHALVSRRSCRDDGPCGVVSVDWTDGVLCLRVEVPTSSESGRPEGLRHSVVRAVVDALGGSLRAHADAEGVERILVEVPAPLSSATGPQVLPDDVDVQVLVVDDNALNRLVLQRMLEQIGARVHVAEDGAEALDHLARQPFALVLMDLDMPVMDGFAATREARRLGYCVPIVAVTASAMSDTAGRVAEAGMDGLVVKPAKPAQILPIVHAAVLSATAA